MQGTSDKITVYEAGQRQKIGFLRIVFITTRDLKDYWELVVQLYKRDFLMKYKQSFLGMGWLILGPLLGFVQWMFMNSAGVLNPGDFDFPYPAYLLISTTIWGLFANSLIAASQTLTVGKSFINQVYYPHYIMLFKQLLQEYTNYLISYLIVSIVLFLFGISFNLSYYFMPILVLPLMIFAGAIGLMLSVLSAVSLDVEKILSYVTALWMFITPVVYSAQNKHGFVKVIITYNPLTYLHGAVRDTAIFGSFKHLDVFIYLSISSFLLLLLSIRWFYIAEIKVIEKMV